MAILNHVHRRGAVYVWRRRIPAVVTHEGGHFVQVSLGTRELSTARRLASLVNVAFDASIPDMTDDRITRHEAQALLARVVRDELARIEHQRYLEPRAKTPGEWHQRHSAERARVAALRLVAARGEAAALCDRDRQDLMREGFFADDCAAVERALADVLSEIRTPHFEAESASLATQSFGRAPASEADASVVQSIRLTGLANALARADRQRQFTPFTDIHNTAPPMPEIASPLAGPPGPAAAAPPAPCPAAPGPADGPHVRAVADAPRADTADGPESSNRGPAPAPSTRPASRYSDAFADLIPDFLDKTHKQVRDPAGNKKIAKSRRQAQAVLSQFVQAIDRERLGAVRREDIAFYLDTLDRLPKIYGRNEEDRRRTLHEILERAEELPDDEVGLSANTVNRNLSHLRKLLKFARSRGLTPAEPINLSDYRLRVDEDARSARLAFTDDDGAALIVGSGAPRAAPSPSAGTLPGEEEFVVCAVWPAQSEPIEAEGPLEAGKQQLDLLPQIHRDHV